MKSKAKSDVRKFRGYSPERKVAGEGALWKKVGVEKGFGPRHAANALEGDLRKVNTDTVPAMLTPREAVLNRNAAELAGRGKIEALNAEGNKLAKKGVDLAAKGDEDVGGEDLRNLLAGGGAQSARERQLWDKYGVMPPEAELYPDFYKLRDELGLDSLAAQDGVGEVPGLQGGTEKFMGPGAGDRRTAATTMGKWGDVLGPNSVAVSPADIASGKYQPGQWINTPRGWKQVQDTSWVSPGQPNPAGTIEYWLGGKGGGKRRGGSGLDMLPAGKADRKSRDISTPASWGLGTQFFETPESWFSHATPSLSGTPSPTPAPQGQSGVGQVSGDTGNVGYAAGTYTGVLGGPGDPGGGGGGLEVRNELGYNPSYPYGSFGSGVPTRKAFGALGNILGGGLLGAAVPGVGNLIGGQVGGKTGSWLGKLFNNWRMNQGVGGGKAPPTPSGSVPLPTGGGRGDAWHDTSGQGLGGWGQPMGYFDIPNYMGIGDRGAPTTIAGSPSGQGTIANTGITQNDIAASGVTPRSVQSVGAPSGGYAPMGFSGPSNLRRWGGGWGDDARDHFNPYFGGYSADKMAGGPAVKLRAKGDADVSGGETMKSKHYQGGGNVTPYPYAGVSGGTPASYPFAAGSSQPGYTPQPLVTSQPGGLPFMAGKSGNDPWGGRPLPQRKGKYAARNSGFYPPGQGMFASGTGDVGIGDPDPQSIGSNFGAPPELTAPNLGPLVAALMAEGKKQGLSAGQMQSILGAFQGMGGGAGSASDMATAATGAYQGGEDDVPLRDRIYRDFGDPRAMSGKAYDDLMHLLAQFGGGGGKNALEPVSDQEMMRRYPGLQLQGGISDIGYPPFAAPNAEYHADKGSTWIGQYDPNIMIPRY